MDLDQCGSSLLQTLGDYLSLSYSLRERSIILFGLNDKGIKHLSQPVATKKRALCIKQSGLLIIFFFNLLNHQTKWILKAGTVL